MKRPIHQLGFAFLLLSAAFTASAYKVVPQPGVEGQVTTTATFFANDLEVCLTEDDGVTPFVPELPVQVNFTSSDGRVLFADDGALHPPGTPVVGIPGSGQAASITDADGCATAPGAIGYNLGAAEVVVQAILSGASLGSIPLTVQAGGPSDFTVLAGKHQISPVGYTYNDRWAVRALDSSGQPVPRAAVIFKGNLQGQPLPDTPAVTFGIDYSIWVRADANGVAMAPYATANMVSGHNEGVAMTLNLGVARARNVTIPYTNLPAPAATRCVKGKGPPCGP